MIDDREDVETHNFYVCPYCSFEYMGIDDAIECRDACFEKEEPKIPSYKHNEQ